MLTSNCWILPGALWNRKSRMAGPREFIPMITSVALILTPHALTVGSDSKWSTDCAVQMVNIAGFLLMAHHALRLMEYISGISAHALRLQSARNPKWH